MRDLYSEFESWYLVAASYNMGENGLRRLINKHKTRNFWELADLGALPQETREYVPKLLAAMLIAKAPSLYGFRDLDLLEPIKSNYVRVPAGTQLDLIADYIGVTRKALRDLNPELKFGVIPREVPYHQIKIPDGAYPHVKKYLALASKTVAIE
jgi:membrane-bound lytic murein transglycosylase D